MSSKGSVGIKNIIVHNYSPYYASFIGFGIRNKDLAFGSNYSFSKAGSPNEILANGLYLKLKGLEVLVPGERSSPLAVPELGITGTSADIEDRSLIVGSLKTKGGNIRVERRAGNEINLLELLPSAGKGGKKGPSMEEAPADKKSKDTAWNVRLKSAEVANYKIAFSDRTTPQPVDVSLHSINIAGKDISTEENEKGEVDFSAGFNKSGKIHASCELTLNPMGLDTQFHIDSLALGWSRPYYMDKVKVLVTGGKLSTKGQASASFSDDISAKAKVSLEINDLSVVDEAKTENLVKWDNFRVEGMGLAYAPLSLNIEKIVLAKPVSNIVVREDGSLNLASIMVKEASESGPAKKAHKEKPKAVKQTDEKPDIFPIKIREVSIESGKVNFEDRSVQPRYSAEMSDIHMNVKDLDSSKMESGEMHMKSKLNKNFPFEVAGKLNPVTEDLFVDLEINLSDMDLSPLTPYSGKYIGKTVQKGKLSLDLDYFIKENKLDSKNKVFIDQLTFGKNVKSEEATNLPVGLAVSLLKDRKGRILLNLPVTGKLDDPSFSIGGVILTMLKNILVKAATSPFSLVSAVVGGGEDLSHIQFEYGTSTLSKEARKKLDLLAEALYKRPELNVELTGYSSVEKDKQVMLEECFERAQISQAQGNLGKRRQVETPGRD